MSCESENENAPASAPAPNSDLEQMKEKFVKLLLGEDMTGRGNGVSSALALSNEITNLAALVFGKQNKLAPVPEDRKRRWRKEIDWLLSVTDNIVEFVPSQQIGKDGSTMEIMVQQQRKDLHMDIPALKKLDAMLLLLLRPRNLKQKKKDMYLLAVGYYRKGDYLTSMDLVDACLEDRLDKFKENKEFWYVPEDADESIDKWWIPRVKVPPEGLSDETRKWMQIQKDCCNQVLKAAMAINAQVLSEMEIPETYIDTLPKNGKTSMGDLIYKSITDDFFDPVQVLSTMDMSSEQNVMDMKNKMEASIVIWKRKMNHKDAKSSWSSITSLEKRELFEERAETILLLIKQKFPGLAQSSLDISKIEYNKDVGHSILESYSRVLENLANTVIGLIEDVLEADEVANPSAGMLKRNLSINSVASSPRFIRSPSLLKERTPFHSPRESPARISLGDSKGWGMMDHGEMETIGNTSPDFKTTSDKIPPKAKMSYIEKLEAYRLRSPTARH